jgi:hypothetical protein
MRGFEQYRLNSITGHMIHEFGSGEEKAMKKLVIILIVLLVPSVALANFSIRLENTFDKKMYYLLYWIDHPYNWRGPANIAGGELEGLESVEIPIHYDSGKYYVIWRDTGQWKNRVQFDVESDVSHITISPEKVDF